MQTITPAADMKKMFVLSMLVSFAMICSCQKQNSVAEQQLVQRKMELDAREQELAERKNALDERESVLNEREKSLAEKEKATMNARTNPTNVQGQTPDPAQVQAEKDRMIQQLSGMRDSSREDVEKAEKEREIQRAQKLPGLGKLQGQQQLGADELEKQTQRKLEAAGISPAPQ
jgi:hypothetical protein